MVANIMYNNEVECNSAKVGADINLSGNKQLFNEIKCKLLNDDVYDTT